MFNKAYNIVQVLLILMLSGTIALLSGCGSTESADNKGFTFTGPDGGTVQSSDGKASVNIPAGALAEETAITVKPSSDVPAGNIGPAYEFLPAGVNFLKPVTITISYEDSAIPAGLDESDLCLAIVVNSEWEQIASSVVDAQNNIVSSEVSHFSRLSIMSRDRAPADGMPEDIIPFDSSMPSDSIPVNIAPVDSIPSDSTSDESSIPEDDIPVASKPRGVMAFPESPRLTNSKITIRWTPVEGATSYNIYWSKKPGVSKASGNKISNVKNPYTHKDLIPGTTYYYIVTAVNRYGESVQSLETEATTGRVYISAGSEHVAALKNDGTVWTWGLNTWGQLGDGTLINSTAPVQVSGLTDVIAVAADRTMTMALKSDGTVWTWGLNNEGQLGDGSNVKREVPGQVIGLTDVIAIATGWSTGIALKSDGTVWSWGENEYGAVGDGTTDDRFVPDQVVGLTDIVAISAKRSHILALKSDGTLWAWGHNRHGQHGNGTATGDANSPGPVPVQVSELTDPDAAIAAGYWHSMALKSDGTFWTWGRNEASELCDGTSINKSIPGKTTGVADLIAVDGGEGYTILLKRNGTVWMCGNNSSGLLGTGEPKALISTPAQVSDLYDVVAITSGRYFSVVLKRDGTIWTWGYNNKGQLGDGTTNHRDAPVPVLIDPLF